MTKRALIDQASGQVVQVVNSVADQFEVHTGLYWTDCPDTTQSAFTLQADGTFLDPHANNRDQFGNTVEPFYMQRARAYASGADQFDMLYKELMSTGTISPNGPWASHITAIKQAIPKPATLIPAVTTQPDIVVPSNPPSGYAQAAPTNQPNIVKK